MKFSSDIFLVNKDDFRAVRDQLVAPHEDERIAGVPWSLYNRVMLEPRGLTEGAYDCNAGGITNGQSVSLFHLIPKGVSPGMVQNELGRDIQRLKDQGGFAPRALITGGKAYNPDFEPRSRMVFETLNATMQAGGLEDRVTRLWGRKNARVDGPTDALYDAATDRWYLHVQRRTKLAPDLGDVQRGLGKLISKALQGRPVLNPSEALKAFHSTDAKPAALSMTDLKDTFEVVHIAKGDQVITPEDKGYRDQLDEVLA